MSFFSESLTTKVLGSLIILSTTSYSAQAKPISQEKKEVLKQASNFAQAVACSTTFANDAEDYKTTVKDIYLTEKDKEYAEYFVFWSGEPPRDCRRLNILREYDNEKTNLHS